MQFESLLEPISEDQPCGEDISYLPEFMELDKMIAGQPETQFSEAVKPDWKLVHLRCLELFKKSKHLQVCTVFCVSSLQTGGLTVAAGALELLEQLLRKYWDELYPRLDPDDDNDPLERMNIISALSTPIGTFGDNYQFLERLHDAPLTNSPVLGRLSYNALIPESGEEGGGEAPDQAQIDAAFQDTPQENVVSVRDSIQLAKTSAQGMNDFLTEKIGSQDTPSFTLLINQLGQMEKLVSTYIHDAEPMEADAEESGDAPAATAATASGVPSAPGAINSRADVVAALDRICRYYAKHEPSSPLPLLLDRAKKLVHGDFLSIVTELAPDSVPGIRKVAGLKDDEEASA